MWLYWLMFVVPAWAVLVPQRLRNRQEAFVWVAVGALFALAMGLRYQIGGDWFAYEDHFFQTAGMPLLEVLNRGDPGYYILNWVIARSGGSIHHVNLLCASVLMVGTVVFCRRQPFSWLALLVAVPYMLIVVGMGYTRQSVALGFALLALTALGDGRIRTFVLWTAIGATFHKSAILLLPIAALAASSHRVLTAALIGGTAGLLYYLLMADSTEKLWEAYVVAGYESEGGLIRVLMNAIPAIMVIFFGERIFPGRQVRRLWMWMAAFALVCVGLVGLASTAVDRVALYLIPIQLAVFSRLPATAGTVRSRTLIVVCVIVYYLAVLVVWLNFATHARYWVPYRMMPL